MADPKWVTVEAIKALHSLSIDLHGGVDGVRDAGLLESALARPKTLLAYGQASSIPELAAAYCAGLTRNHPSLDGNKRAAILAAAVFLEINGFLFRPEEPEVVHMILGLAAGEVDETALAQWISDNSTPKAG